MLLLLTGCSRPPTRAAAGIVAVEAQHPPKCYDTVIPNVAVKCRSTDMHGMRITLQQWLTAFPGGDSTNLQQCSQVSITGWADMAATQWVALRCIKAS